MKRQVVVPRRNALLSSTSLATTLLVLTLAFASLANAYTEMSEAFLKAIPLDHGDFDILNERGLLAPILIPRVPGTPGQVQAQQHITSFFARELPKWNVSWQNSTGTTPVTGNKQVPFQNIIVRREPPWTKPGQANYLTLVAHYDSKISPEGFIGATDSAVPCAVLMYVAKSIDKYLTQMHDEMTALGEGGTIPQDMAVQLLFLDGEEAFASWTDTDSVYGARALASHWESSLNPAMSFYKNPLDQISLFVLLDLLGSANPAVPSYFQTTHWAYQRMATVETRMRNFSMLESVPTKPFLPEPGKTKFSPGGIGDDHIPFLKKGVEVLHIIPSPFPDVWHRMEDDGAHLDMATVRDWARITTTFVMEWLDMMEVAPEGAEAEAT
ncbi:hypothetical protein PspLS_11150 [Pyricularia sp. CBS 133598]|nr:hypothetical protein PspLS_11150 [Pyricularia sp. CBS 133598]